MCSIYYICLVLGWVRMCIAKNNINQSNKISNIDNWHSHFSIYCKLILISIQLKFQNKYRSAIKEILVECAKSYFHRKHSLLARAYFSSRWIFKKRKYIILLIFILIVYLILWEMHRNIYFLYFRCILSLNRNAWLHIIIHKT